MHPLSIREPFSTWSHFLWMLLALPAGLVLLRLSRNEPRKWLGMAVFSVGLVACYGGSALFHAVPARLSEPCNVLDHIGIYLLIAGTATPVALVLLRGRWRSWLLITIWLMACAGIALRLVVDPPPSVRTALYLFMGWVGCVTYFELARCLSPRRLLLLLLGGLFYSIGAIINLAGWDLVPGLSAHDLFHLFVMAGSLAHWWFMLVVVVPHGRPAVAPLQSGADPLPCATSVSGPEPSLGESLGTA